MYSLIKGYWALWVRYVDATFREAAGAEHRIQIQVLNRAYSRSPKIGNPIASILKSHVWGIPALIVLNPVSNFLGFTKSLVLNSKFEILYQEIISHRTTDVGLVNRSDLISKPQALVGEA